MNPAHLQPVTRRENLIRGDTIVSKNARKNECAKGHPLEFRVDNSRQYPRRFCRVCFNITQREKRAKTISSGHIMMQIQNLMMSKIKISVNGRTVEIDPTNVVTLDDSGKVLYQ